MKKFLVFVQSYIVVALIFIVASVLIKAGESISLLISKDLIHFSVFIRGFSYTLIASCFYSLVLLPLYFVLRFIGKNVAIAACSIIFSILLLLEIGLTIYSIRTGTLMGSELFLRPLSETVQTIRASMNLFVPICGIVLIIVLFLFLTFKLRRRKYSKAFLLSLFLLILIGSSLMFTLNMLSKSSLKPVERNYIINKSWYCISSAFTLKDSAGLEASMPNFPVEKDILEEFIADYPNRQINNYEYPLERDSENIPDVLSPYFKESDASPNIVIIIVESLGREWSGHIENGISFTPFIDSLAQSGLYWSNCLSTTTRSYGAVPAITASAPYGIKGFQFGVMPNHHSMITILNSNNYQSNAFYGGDFTFDGIYDYLLAQDIGYMSDFYLNRKKYQTEGLTNWWGLYDHALFTESMKVLNESNRDAPLFNLFITLTGHDNLNLKDDNMQKFYIDRTKQILSEMNEENQSKFQSNLSRIASMVYTDDCLRYLFSDYRRRTDFSNTIFIITGDHASGLNTTNKLSYFHVPLLIWSPLIHTAQHFSAIVTHNDITPSILSLLQNTYKLNMPETVHWISDGLDSTSSFRAKEKMLILNYNREIREFLYEDYYYFTKNKWEEESVFRLNEYIDLLKSYDEDIKKEIAQKFNAFKYVNNYVYHNNRLLNVLADRKEPYTLIKEYKSREKIICVTPAEEPSKKAPVVYELIPQTEVPSGHNWKKLRVSLVADVYINDSLWQDEYMNLEISCTGTNMYPIHFKDKIVKFISSEIIRENTWYKLSLVKEILVEGAEDLKLSVKVSTAEYDNEWVANATLTITNVDVKIEGVEQKPPSITK